MVKGGKMEELIEVLKGIEVASIFIAVFVGGLFITKITEFLINLDGKVD